MTDCVTGGSSAEARCKAERRANQDRDAAAREQQQLRAERDRDAAACDADPADPEACLRVATYDQAREPALDNHRTHARFLIACDAQLSGGCIGAARTADTSAESYQLYARACLARSASTTRLREACGLAFHHLPFSRELAVAACEVGEPAACEVSQAPPAR